MKLVRGPCVIGRLRAVLLAGVALAALADLVTFAAVVGEADARPGPEAVAQRVIRAVADDDCAGLDEVLAPDADLPASVTRCLAGATSPTALDDVRVVGGETDGDAASVTVGVAADGQDAAVVVDLRRDDAGAWLVTGVRPA